MQVARAAARVLLDASPFFLFAAAGQLAPLARYLGERAYVTLEVQAELVRNEARVPALQNLQRLNWPGNEPLELPVERQEELLDLLRAHNDPGAHRLQNAGEISTVLMAQELGGCVVVLEDRLGKRLAANRGVARLSTAQLAAEIGATGAVGVDAALRVFEVATPRGVGKREFSDAIAKAKRALGTD